MRACVRACVRACKAQGYVLFCVRTTNRLARTTTINDRHWRMRNELRTILVCVSIQMRSVHVYTYDASSKSKTTRRVLLDSRVVFHPFAFLPSRLSSFTIISLSLIHTYMCTQKHTLPRMRVHSLFLAWFFLFLPPWLAKDKQCYSYVVIVTRDIECKNERHFNTRIISLSLRSGKVGHVEQSFSWICRSA